MINLRRAAPEDAPAIADLKASVWPNETASASYMAEVIQSPDHVTLLAVQDGSPAGFVDAFLTLAPDGTRRWEIDLLAVHPRAQGQGLSKALVNAVTGRGPAYGAVLARALIKEDNIASQRAFAACGYRAADTATILMVSTASETTGDTEPGPDAHLIPVATLAYRGLWLEGAKTARAFNAAGAICAHHQWDVSGAAIIEADAAALETAAQAGYRHAGRYRWWRFQY